MALSKDDYLKKYLSMDDIQKSTSKSKSKKKAKPKVVSGIKIVDADEDFGTIIDKKTSRTANVGKQSFKLNHDADISVLDDDEEEDEPIVVLVNNRVDELKMIGKFKSSSWNNVDPEEKLSKIKREINSPSPSHSNAQNGDRPIKIEPIGRSERRRHDSSDSDLSVKRSRHSQVVDKSRRHDSSDSDQSLERTDRRNNSRSPSNQSIEKRKKIGQKRRHDLSDSDQSLERRPIKKEKDDDFARKRRCSSNSDRSVERRHSREENVRNSNDGRRQSSDSDQSVERQRFYKSAKTSKKDHDLNRKTINIEPADDEKIPQKRHRRHSSGSDISIERNRTEDRKSKNSESSSRIDYSSKLNEPVKRKAQYDKNRGRKKKRELTEEEKKRQEELKKKYEVWNKGVKQVKDRQEKLDEMADLIDKPLARYRDDKDLDEHLKSQLLEEDPMSEYMHKKAVEENKSSGNAPKVSLKPKYKGQAPANRYGILPGYRWDSVDRSNGFENKLLSQANVKKAQEEEYYAWSSGQYE